MKLSALKHVRSEEDPFTLMRMIDVNILNTDKTIKQAIKNSSKKYFCVSTDKAANPINLYGASKLCSDKLFIAANNLVGKRATRFSVVRYGNVAGSRGSVIPYFKSLSLNNKKIFPITDTSATRFIIELQDGVNFVLQSLINL